MLKKYKILLLVGIFSLFAFLLTFGFQTENFNDLIQKRFNEQYKKVKLEFKNVRVSLDIKNFSVKFHLNNPKLYHKGDLTNIYETNFGIGIFSAIKGNYNPKFLQIKFSENSFEKSISLVRDVFLEDSQRGYLDNKIKKGTIQGELKIYNDNALKIEFSGSVKDAYFIVSNDLPQFENINANINYKDNELNVNILSGSTAGLSFDKSKILVSELESGYKAILDVSLAGKFNSIKEFKNLKINNLDNITENIEKLSFSTTANNKIEIEFDKKGNLLNTNVKGKAELFNLDLDLYQTSFPNVLDDKNRKFKNGKFKVEFDRSNLFINGVIFNQNDILDFKINSDLSKNTSKVNIISDVNFSNWQKVIKPEYIKGSSKFYIQLNTSKDQVSFESRVDIKKSLINFTPVNFTKLLNDDGQINLKGEIKKNRAFLEKVSISSGKNNIELLDLDFDENFSLLSLNSISVNTDKSNFKVLSNKKNSINNIEIEGKRLDAKFIIDSLTSSKSSTFISKKFNGLISAKLDLIDTGTNDNIRDFVLTGTITKGKFTKLDASGKFSNNEKITIKINKNKNGNLATYLLSDRARPFIAGYSFIKGFEKGKLEFTSEDLSATASKGKIVITDFKIKEIPVLAQILSLASVTGILDTLRGEGIRFDNTVIVFENDENFFTFKDFYGTGPAIGFIVEGKINNEDHFASLDGNIIPAYEVNRLISNIPVLGQILTGKSGDGVFGVSFKLKGKDDKYDITINPVRTITPRFLQRFIDIFRTAK
ncbi:MAG: AsmA-like C-terminal domain-containing protein [Pseudomonadota bacterium]